MDEYIKRETALKEILSVYEREFPTVSGAFDEFVTKIVPNILACIPSADVTPVRRGHWGCYEPLSGGYRCSRCKLTHRNCTAYCPNCGAKMETKNYEERN